MWGRKNASTALLQHLPTPPASAPPLPAALLLASACSSPCPSTRCGARGCTGLRGVQSRGKRVLMCSGDPRPAQPPGLALLPQLPTRARGCSGGCSGGCGASRIPTLSSGSRGTGRPGEPLAATGPQALASPLRSRWGWQRGSLPSPPGTPASPDGAPCCSAAAPALLSPGELAEGMPAFILPSSRHPLRLLQTQLLGQGAG